jgi:hypothetical protein
MRNAIVKQQPNGKEPNPERSGGQDKGVDLRVMYLLKTVYENMDPILYGKDPQYA